MKKKSIVLYTILISASVFSLVGCGDKTKNTTPENIEVIEFVDSINTAMNLRYIGIDNKEQVDKLIDSTKFTENNKILLKSAFTISDDEIENGVFISLEEQFKDREFEPYEFQGDVGSEKVIVAPNYDGLTDGKIIELNGERGVYSKNVYIDTDGYFRTMIYGEDVYVEAPDKAQLLSVKGSPDYKFRVSDYRYFDGGKLLVKLSSDIEGAFNERYSRVNIVEDESQIPDDALILHEGYVEYGQNAENIYMTQELYDMHKEQFMQDFREIQVNIEAELDAKSGEIKNINLDYFTKTFK